MHRNWSTNNGIAAFQILPRKDIPATDMRGLRGKTFALPSKFSNQSLVIHKLMEDQGVKPNEIKFVEIPPPDMPGALAARAIDAYFVGEPHAAKAELDGEIAIRLGGLHLRYGAWAGLDDGHGHNRALLVVNAGHPDFFSKQCGGHVLLPVRGVESKRHFRLVTGS